MSGTRPAVGHEIDIEIACPTAHMPPNAQLAEWVGLALRELSSPVSVGVRVVDEEEIRELNRRYRDRDRPTNVLSFPAAGLPVPFEVRPLGDIMVCAPVVAREAAEQGIAEAAHWAHMLIHGALHLQGFDHLFDEDAEEMESRETALLAAAGFPNPYR